MTIINKSREHLELTPVCRTVAVSMLAEFASQDEARSALTRAVTLACAEKPDSPAKVSFPNQKP